MPKLRLLILDFDGVISQSAPECFLVALNAYHGLVAHHHLPVRGPLTAPEVPAFIEAQPELYERFLELIPKGTKAADFFSVFSEPVVKAERALPGPPAARDLEEGRRPEGTPGEGVSLETDVLQREFYRWRERLRQEDFAAWVGLHGVFPGVPEALRVLAGRLELAIATAKDARSVAILLDRFGLTPCFPAGRVLAQDAAPAKSGQVERILAETGVPPEQTLFVDDKVSQLILVSAREVSCALALWGYNGEDERREAQRRGFRLLTLEDLPRLGLP